MGCGASAPPEPKPAAGGESKYKEEEKPKKKEPEPEKKVEQSAPAATATPAPEPASPQADNAPVLPHRGKHMPYPCLREVTPEPGEAYYVSCYPHLGELRGICFACVKVPPTSGDIYYIKYTDAELTKLKEDRGVKLQWGSFWKALNVAFGKGDGTVRVLDGGKKLDITLKSSKDPKNTPFPLDLTQTGGLNQLFEHFVAPGATAYKLRKMKADEAAQGGDDDKEKGKGAREEEHARREAQLNQHDALAKQGEETSARLQPILEPLRIEAKELSGQSSDLQKEVDRTQRRIKTLRGGGQTVHPLDGIYTSGGPRSFQHVSFAKTHEPKEQEADPAFVEMVKRMFPRPEAESNARFQEVMANPMSDPACKAAVEALGAESAQKVFECFKRIDSWDYDCFAVDEARNGQALFNTAFCLFWKTDLVQHFKIDPEILANFWQGTQAGYHHNPYHNANHAADVLQITHYILGPGGMAQQLRLSREDYLAALIAAGIHDYDHPGFNNNFHTRTSGYLSTLYNDRSILENHHCSCIFEMMRHQRYDILTTLNDDQRKEVRDTLVEMLLSTDMGNHAKIFSQFRRRLAESPDWHSRKDDIRLALVMAIKMADISNCGRPLELYKRWAEAIATEFYVQGDAELQLKIAVSPFMDRRKHNTDFPKGQISFINYIVNPLFESMAEFLPCLEFTVRHCQENKEYWQNGDNRDTWMR